MNCVPLGSCNINEVTKTVLNLLFYYFFFYEKISHTQIAQKAQKAQRYNQVKVQKA